MNGDGVGWFIVIVHDEWGDAGDCGGSDKASFFTILAKKISGKIALFNFSIFKFKNSISFSFSTIFFCLSSFSNNLIKRSVFKYSISLCCSSIFVCWISRVLVSSSFF